MADVRPLVPELAEVARTTLDEDVCQIIPKIEELRKSLALHTYLKARTDDQYLIAFLRFCHWNVDKALERIIFYYTYKTNERELLKGRHIDDKIYELARSGIFATLQTPKGPGGPRIHFTRMGHIDTSKISVSDIFRFYAFRAEIELSTDDNWNIAGIIEILDFTKIPYSLLLQFDPGMFRRMNAFLEYGVPSNLVATHIVNASRETQFVLGLVRNSMKQKELLHIHSNLDSLQKAIGIEYLPVEFGGQNGTYPEAVQRYVEQFREFEPYFVEDEQYVVDEQSRLVFEKQSRDNSFVADVPSSSLHKLTFD